MNAELTQIDKAGRLVLPKQVRDHLNLVPGDKLRVSVEGTAIRLEPESTGGDFVKKGSVLVFTREFAEPITSRKVAEMLASDRETRFTQGGKPRKK
jgi:AbrB family looped-hinge helix DNA binding protein